MPDCPPVNLHFEQDPLTNLHTPSNFVTASQALHPHSESFLGTLVFIFFRKQTHVSLTSEPLLMHLVKEGWKLKSPFPHDKEEVITVLGLKIMSYICVFRSLLMTLSSLSYIKREILFLPPSIIPVLRGQSLNSFVTHARRSEHSHNLCIVTEQRTESRSHQQLSPS